MTTTSDILQKTYDILEARGWCQQNFQAEDGRVCLEGAFNAAVTGSAMPCRTDLGGLEAEAAWNALRAAVKEHTGCLAPCQFNDKLATTAEDVKLVLKKAIADHE